jgi:RNA polymerase sigma-70 factor (ECF subfamily)
MTTRPGASGGDLQHSAQERELSEAMAKAQQGDAAAYRKVLEQLAALARRYVRHALGRRYGLDAGDCEDVVQEILLAVHNKRHTHDPKQFLLPWFYGIARYKVIDEIRRLTAARKVESYTEELEVEGRTEDVGARMDVRRLLQELPAKQRKVLQLVKLDGLSVQEASGRTGYSESDVRVSVHRALKALRKRITETGKGMEQVAMDLTGIEQAGNED